MSKTSPCPLKAEKSDTLKGEINVPGDKSISHRSLMFASMAIGESSITGLLEAEDVINTAKAMAALGAQVERYNDGTWKVRGVGVGGFSQPRDIIDFGNSGTGVRLCAGLVATTPIKVGFTGDDSLCSRPMKRITDPLRLFGAKIDTLEGDLLPMRIIGAAQAVPIEYTLPVASAQVKSAVLLAGLNAPGKTSVIEPEATRDHTEKMLKAFGAKISVSQETGRQETGRQETGRQETGRQETGSQDNQVRTITVEGQHELIACDISVPGDPSSAAFAIVAALITQNSQITIKDVLLNPTRVGLIDSLIEMGGNIIVENQRCSGGEDLGDISVSSSQLSGITVPASRAPSMIDEYPVLAIAASFAKGTTRMEGIGELRVKESDRLSFVSDGLADNGVIVRSGPDWMEVDGAAIVKGGGLVKTGLDHRIAMSFIVLGLATQEPVIVDDGNIIATSFPGFEDLMRGLGCKITEVSAT